MFADNILLLAHTVSAMRHMLKICDLYAIYYDVKFIATSCAGGPTICPRPCKLTFDLLTLKVVSESRVTRATSMPILVFLVLVDLGPMYAIDRQTSDMHHRLMPLPKGRGITSLLLCVLILAMMPCVRAA